MNAGQELTEGYTRTPAAGRKNHLTRSFRKFQPARFSRRITGAGTWVRSLTAMFIMMMAVLSPVHVLEGYASPVPDLHESVPAIVEDTNTDGTRTDFGAALTKKQKSRILATALLMKASAAEPAVTADMKELERRNAQLQGLDYRLKSIDSLARKIESDAEEDQTSLAAAANGISDVLRYTLTCSADDYSEMVPSALASLQSKGYTVEKFRNAWGGKFYQGINVHLMSPTGVRVELQFHTPQSFAVKQASHEVYEIRRNPASSPEAVAEATRLSLAYNAAVVAPQGAAAIVWPLAA